MLFRSRDQFPQMEARIFPQAEAMIGKEPRISEAKTPLEQLVGRAGRLVDQIVPVEHRKYVNVKNADRLIRVLFPKAHQSFSGIYRDNQFTLGETAGKYEKSDDRMAMAANFFKFLSTALKLKVDGYQDDAAMAGGRNAVRARPTELDLTDKFPMISFPGDAEPRHVGRFRKNLEI